jgi:hypothetical protein
MGPLQTKCPARAARFAAISLLALPSLSPANGRVIELIQDFETSTPPALRAGLPLKASLSAKGENGDRCLEAVIPANFTWRWKGWNS